MVTLPADTVDTQVPAIQPTYIPELQHPQPACLYPNASQPPTYIPKMPIPNTCTYLELHYGGGAAGAQDGDFVLELRLGHALQILDGGLQVSREGEESLLKLRLSHALQLLNGGLQASGAAVFPLGFVQVVR